jgi:hypothetical protein
MRFIVNGAEYEAASLERITGRDALALAKQVGIGVQTLARALMKFGEAKRPEDLLDDPDMLTALLALVWLSRRVAGESSLTFDESCDFPILSLVIEGDADDEEADETPDPQSSPGGAAEGDAPGA